MATNSNTGTQRGYHVSIDGGLNAQGFIASNADHAASQFARSRGMIGIETVQELRQYVRAATGRDAVRVSPADEWR